MIRFAAPDVWLARLWWPIWPAFSVLAGVLAVERACGQPYRLLPGATSQPALAWALAALYLAAHLWLLAAYVVIVQRSDTLVPRRTVLREVWGTRTFQIWLMLAVFAIEYAPLSIWRLASRGMCAG